MLPQHTPATRCRSKAPSSAPTISSEKICCATNICSLISNWFDMRKQAPGVNRCTHLFQAQASSSVLKFACRGMSCLQGANQIGFFFSSHAPIGLFRHSAPSSRPSCVLDGVLTRERVSGVCFRSKLPCVYWPLCSISLKFSR